MIGERYAPLIDGLYSDTKHVEAEVVVTYEDGRTGAFRSTADIWDVGRPDTQAQSQPAA